MKSFIILLFLLFALSFTNAQNPKVDSTFNSFDNSIIYSDTLVSFLIKKNPPFLFNANLNNKEKPLGNKILKASYVCIGYDALFLGILINAPESISKWENKEEKFKFSSIMAQYKNSFTKPPVIDKDLFITNYIGHPYEGGFYYNTMRSQGATVLESSLFCLGQSLIWEYIWEAGIEQPSIQDLITTPLCGILVGELSHIATLSMSRNGFRWYEIATVCLINPAYAINNNFKFNKKLIH